MTTLSARSEVVAGGPGEVPAGSSDRRPTRNLAPVALVDLLDRLLGAGVFVAGDVVISLAGVDLVEVRLHLLVSSVRAEMAETRRPVP
ncbi:MULTISPECIES: gas vesicle protein [unclassified Nocardioides]|uniref:gas vesicle protein n=1 Tax=Nocardioides sp. URHA0032 TaxID=1380388 RepID=UPI0009DD950E|nr:gas vesicle protein [Nocardioides sp. URHA0032]